MNDDWTQRDASLKREFVFADFVSAIDFVGRVAELAEEADHHPDILIHSYRKVTITLTTHSSGTVTEADRSLASRIDFL